MASKASEEDRKTCCLTSCANRTTDLCGQSHVEVKAYAPPKLNAEYKVRWSSEGYADFHSECWRRVTTGDVTGLHAKEKTMIEEAAKTAEYFESTAEVESKAKHIAELLKTAKHAIAFTGAGISTSAGIGDFRGKGGVWTERDKQKIHGKAAAKPDSKRKSVAHADLRPTYTHEAIAKLAEMGLLKYVISQNVDGIHRLSGVPAAQISELHGNIFHEKCEKCKARYERSYPVRSLQKQPTTAKKTVPPKRCANCNINHRTGARCEKPGCDGFLMNTIINFGDNLERDVMDRAEEHAALNDFVLCLGSTLRVTPACDYVQMGEPVRIAICNRQPTPFDGVCERAGCRVFGDCDQLMRDVMANVLTEDELRQWEDARPERMLAYDTQRLVLK